MTFGLINPMHHNDDLIATVTCDGADKIRAWTNGVRVSFPIQLPLTGSSVTFRVEGITNSDALNDVAFTAKVEYRDHSGVYSTIGAAMTILKVEMVDSDLSAELDSDAVITDAGKIWIHGGVIWSATIHVAPLAAKGYVGVRVLQTIKGAMKRIYRSPVFGVTGSKTDADVTWHYDGSSETAEWTDEGAFYQLVNGDIPELRDDPDKWSSLEMDLEFEVFIQYRIASGPWLTLEKGTWKTLGEGEAIPAGGEGYIAYGTIENDVTANFSASSDHAIETPRWDDLDWEDY